jgi:hypothetical protein
MDLEHFWVLARDVRAYCRDTGLRVGSRDSVMTRRFGFYTIDVPTTDSRYREWWIRLTALSLTANKRDMGYEGFTDADMILITQHMREPSGRGLVAEHFSTGVLPPATPG